jgi:hypothetical protein
MALTYTEEQFNDMLREKAAELQAVHHDYAAQIEEINQRHAAALAAAQGQPATSSSTLLTSLDTDFEALPAEIQAMFEPAWTTVRNLIQAGKNVRAYNFVSALTVPENLAAPKAAILEKLAA